MQLYEVLDDRLFQAGGRRAPYDPLKRALRVEYQVLYDCLCFAAATLPDEQSSEGVAGQPRRPGVAVLNF